ncbi:hypothetical protein [Nocardioides baculatus]|uniref:Polysaccharide chain length determinant N-terminal domain-containing protein n=1 Tax=Nocardioides baculatus TaxID=2801337 RepID=A0ABS1L9Z1_9ACTN|nr:hypothetical protein [Nocardioides baculatus]MBL0748510.1 hypothetical protein [Nocardioides baculatus]
MGSWQVAVLLVRRWYVTLGAFLATIGVSALVYASLPAQYQTGSVMVVTTSLTGRSEEPPSQEPDLTNPLLNFENDVNLSTAILIEQLNSPGVAEALGAPAGSTTTYVVSDGNTNAELLQSGPLLFVQGNGPTPEAARSITERVDAMAALLLERRQRDLEAPPSTYLRTSEIVPPTAGLRLTRSPSRAVVATGALAAAAGLAAALGFDRLAAARRRSATTRTVSAPVLATPLPEGAR